MFSVVKSIIILFFIILLSAEFCVADEIYSWTDKNGKVHFSTKPVSPKASKADLPEVKRENLSEKIKEIKSLTPPNCSSHGGIDCSIGADEDGSVICSDGYRDARLPYRFHCLEVRMTAGNLELMTSEKEIVGIIKRNEALSRSMFDEHPDLSLHLVVRNNSSTAAFGVEVGIKAPGREALDAQGPVSIEPYGIGEYHLPLKSFEPLLSISKIRQLSYNVKCTNCRSVRRK